MIMVIIMVITITLTKIMTIIIITTIIISNNNNTNNNIDIHNEKTLTKTAAGSVSLTTAQLSKVRKFCDQMESPASMFGLDQSGVIKEMLPDTEYLKVSFN
jgi:hypothetical protein